MAKNPVLQHKYKQGYEAGFLNGVDMGKRLAIDHFAQNFKKLNDYPGIGEKTIEKIMQAIGEQYFEKVGKQ